MDLPEDTITRDPPWTKAKSDWRGDFIINDCKDHGAPGLLVSVRSASEAQAALAAGAAIIDVKEPENGSLGRASPHLLAEVISSVAGCRPVSAALGELPSHDPRRVELPTSLEQLSFVKWGLAGWGNSPRSGWQGPLLELRARIEAQSCCRLVVVAYADWDRAEAPALLEVRDFAIKQRASVLLIDTWEKDGSTLLDWMSLNELQKLREMSHSAGVRLALAGSLGTDQIHQLRGVVPDWFAVRGAACFNGQRKNMIQQDRVRQLVEMIKPSTHAN